MLDDPDDAVERKDEGYVVDETIHEGDRCKCVCGDVIHGCYGAMASVALDYVGDCIFCKGI